MTFCNEHIATSSLIAHTVHTDPPYRVVVGAGLLDRLSCFLPSALDGCKLAVISDDVVASLYGERVRSALTDGGYAVSMYTFPLGESSKTLAGAERILAFLADEQLDRSDAIVALGGGVTGDLAGFAAATYLRGIRFVQVPTTLLAAVDSSVGGKTAVNLPQGKNLVGAFWQPAVVVCDTGTLETLPKHRYAEGIAEAVKCGVIGDASLFELLQEPLSPGSEQEVEVIRRSVALKADIVAEDATEQGKRALLNFGHTLAHAIESCSDYEVGHGRAVALGMISVARAAEAEGFSEPGTAEAVYRTLAVHDLADGSDLRDRPNLHIDALLGTVSSDKKRRGNDIVLILPRRIGLCERVSMPLGQALSLLRKGWE